MSVSEITAMLNKDKEGLNIILGNAKTVVLLDVKTNQTLNFKSLTACAEYFRNLGFKTTGNTGLVLRPEVSTTVILLLGGDNSVQITYFLNHTYILNSLHKICLIPPASLLGGVVW
jgi:hypothetical protein